MTESDGGARSQRAQAHRQLIRSTPMPSIRGHRATADSPPRTRRLDLDVVRGAAILLALGWHFSGPTGNVVLDALQWPGEHCVGAGGYFFFSAGPAELLARPLEGKQFGWAGVDLFFVLSGFLMGRL